MGAFVEGLAWEGSVSENVCRRTRVAWRQDRHPASRPLAPAPRSCQVTSVSVQAGGAHVNALACQEAAVAAARGHSVALSWVPRPVLARAPTALLLPTPLGDFIGTLFSEELS